MNNGYIRVGIAGNPDAKAGFQTLISVNDFPEAILGNQLQFPYQIKSEFYIEFSQTDDVARYTFVSNPSFVHSFGSQRGGVFIVHLDLPGRKRIKGMSPYSLLQRVVGLFRDNYMTKDSDDASYTYKEVQIYSPQIFIDDINKLELEDAPRYIEMNGDRAACVRTGGQIAEFFSDPQYDEFKECSKVIVSDEIEGSALSVAIPRPCKYDFYVNQNCILTIKSPQEEVSYLCPPPDPFHQGFDVKFKLCDSSLPYYVMVDEKNERVILDTTKVPFVSQKVEYAVSVDNTKSNIPADFSIGGIPVHKRDTGTLYIELENELTDLSFACEDSNYLKRYNVNVEKSKYADQFIIHVSEKPSVFIETLPDLIVSIEAGGKKYSINKDNFNKKIYLEAEPRNVSCNDDRYKVERVHVEGPSYHYHYALTAKQGSPDNQEKPQPVPPSNSFTLVNNTGRDWEFWLEAKNDNVKYCAEGKIGADPVTVKMPLADRQEVKVSLGKDGTKKHDFTKKIENGDLNFCEDDYLIQNSDQSNKVWLEFLKGFKNIDSIPIIISLVVVLLLLLLGVGGWFVWKKQRSHESPFDMYRQKAEKCLKGISNIDIKSQSKQLFTLKDWDDLASKYQEALIKLDSAAIYNDSCQLEINNTKSKKHKESYTLELSTLEKKQSELEAGIEALKSTINEEIDNQMNHFWDLMTNFEDDGYVLTFTDPVAIKDWLNKMEEAGLLGSDASHYEDVKKFIENFVIAGSQMAKISWDSYDVKKSKLKTKTVSDSLRLVHDPLYREYTREKKKCPVDKFQELVRAYAITNEIKNTSSHFMDMTDKHNKFKQALTTPLSSFKEADDVLRRLN